MDCVKGDSYCCATWGTVFDECAATCNATDVAVIEYAQATCDSASLCYHDCWPQYAAHHMVGHSWEVVCAWEAHTDIDKSVYFFNRQRACPHRTRSPPQTPESSRRVHSQAVRARAAGGMAERWQRKVAAAS